MMQRGHLGGTQGQLTESQRNAWIQGNVIPAIEYVNQTGTIANRWNMMAVAAGLAFVSKAYSFASHPFTLRLANQVGRLLRETSAIRRLGRFGSGVSQWIRNTLDEMSNQNTWHDVDPEDPYRQNLDEMFFRNDRGERELFDWGRAMRNDPRVVESDPNAQLMARTQYLNKYGLSNIKPVNHGRGLTPKWLIKQIYGADAQDLKENPGYAVSFEKDREQLVYNLLHGRTRFDKIDKVYDEVQAISPDIQKTDLGKQFKQDL